LPFLLRFNDEQMRGIVGGFCEYIHAMATPVRINDRHSAPSAHGRQYIARRIKGEYRRPRHRRWGAAIIA
jgi:hypothetical protein